MKKILTFVFAVVLMTSMNSCSLFDPSKGSSDEEESWKSQEVETEEKYKYYKETYEETYQAPFDVVWNATMEAIADKNCQVMAKKRSQTDMGLYKGMIRSDYCVFAQGDTTHQNLKYYSMEVPFIRGANWVNGRMQYEFDLKEQEDGSTHVVLEGEISGKEAHTTDKIHFWESNGYLETMMLQEIAGKVKKAK